MPAINPVALRYMADSGNLSRVNTLSQANGLAPAAKMQLERVQSQPPAGKVDFAETLKGFVDDVNEKQMASRDAVAGVMAGQDVPLHQAVIAMEEAGVAFTMMVEVRNRLLESYQEIMRMQAPAQRKWLS